MAMPPERSKPLHNFSLPQLKWGTQKFLRCTKIPEAAEKSSLGPKPTYLRSSPKSGKSPIRNSSGTGIEAVREKLMTDLRVAADKMKTSVLGGTEDQSAAGARPWNLRTRRAACKAPPSPKEDKERSENLGSPASGIKEKRERPKFSVSLLREEIEEDFAAMAGTRPPRRPKKRPRYVQKELDCIFPGLWLTEVTTDVYKVPEVPES